VSFHDDVNERSDDPEDHVTDTATMPETTIPAVEVIDPEYPRFPPSALAQLRPFIRSRWAACIAKFDEDVQYRDFDRVFGIAEPCIMRTPRSVGPAYAASCIGVRISCYTRDDRLRTGRVGLVDTDGSSQLLAPVVGFIEDAVATPHGIVAVLAITSDWMHKDLLALDDLGQLGLAQLCMLQRMSATRDVTPWGLSVWTVQSTRARLCQFTSLSHVAGQHVIRQMSLDESLNAQDLLPTERRWMPAVCGGNEAPGSAVVADINPGSITTPKCQPLNVVDLGYTIPTSGVTPVFMATTTYTHGLGVIPNCTIDSRNDDVASSITNLTTTQLTVTFIYLPGVGHGTITGTGKLYFW